MELRELENFVDEVYSKVGQSYSKYFKSIIGGCHCIPATEWYGEVYLAFSKLQKDNVIKDKKLKDQIDAVVKLLGVYSMPQIENMVEDILQRGL